MIKKYFVTVAIAVCFAKLGLAHSQLQADSHSSRIALDRGEFEEIGDRAEVPSVISSCRVPGSEVLQGEDISVSEPMASAGPTEALGATSIGENVLQAAGWKKVLKHYQAHLVLTSVIMGGIVYQLTLHAPYMANAAVAAGIIAAGNAIRPSPPTAVALLGVFLGSLALYPTAFPVLFAADYIGTLAGALAASVWDEDGSIRDQIAASEI